MSLTHNQRVCAEVGFTLRSDDAQEHLFVSEDVVILITSWSGNVRPFQGVAYIRCEPTHDRVLTQRSTEKASWRYAGRTGYCVTVGRAVEAGKRIAARMDVKDAQDAKAQRDRDAFASWFDGAKL